MPLRPGERLGPYEILAPIGAGGMGEVWKARDTRLDRIVAIKTSKQEFSERFEREARAVAALNHPNICQLYDVGPDYLVMEFVEGTQLKGPMALEKALEYAGQICQALDAAHSKGIIHRDLKPANILVTKQGVKLLDFGLAKIDKPMVGADDATLTMGLTMQGAILGTLQYMSPEQVQGREADARSDIFSFGLVLYEMLSGKRAFDGKTAASVMGAILERPAPSVAGVAPVALDRVLKKCLEKDPEDRWQSARDLRAALDLVGSGVESRTEVRQQAEARATPRLPWVVAAVFALATFGLGFVAYRHSAEEEPRMQRSSLILPEKASLANGALLPQLSPDGRRVIAAMRIGGSRANLWLRDLDATEFRMLPGTEGAGYPFWSPDGNWVGFFADDKLKKVDILGGAALTVCDAPDARGGAWSPENIIVFGVGGNGLSRVPAGGGAPVVLTVLDRANEVIHRAPWFLPDGRHFLYTARGTAPDKSRIYVDGVDAKPGVNTRREVLAGDTNAIYVPALSTPPTTGAAGYLLFLREATLVAQAFDADEARTTGDARPITVGVDAFPGNSQGNFSASRNGTLVYTSGFAASATQQLSWVDRSGKTLSTVGKPLDVAVPRISPDGSRIAINMFANGTSRAVDIFLFDIARGGMSRFASILSNNSFAVWSPDGQRIGFTRGAKIYVKSTNGVGVEEEVGSGELRDWSSDGRYLIVERGDQKTRRDIWVIPQFGDKKAYPLLHSESMEEDARVSPDGHWIAYASDETGDYQVYVETFPERTGRWQISTTGGRVPVWRADGREIYYGGGSGAGPKLMAVDIKLNGKGIVAGLPKALFDLPSALPFDVAKDGRFLIQGSTEQRRAEVPITLVTNWQAGLKK